MWLTSLQTAAGARRCGRGWGVTNISMTTRTNRRARHKAHKDRAVEARLREQVAFLTHFTDNLFAALERERRQFNNRRERCKCGLFWVAPVLPGYELKSST